MAKAQRVSVKRSRIQELPDDIRILLLSHLSLAEAARTSVLSRTWGHLWNFIPCLNLDATAVLPPRLSNDREIYNVNTYWSASWVSKILNKRSKIPESTVKELRIRFELNARHRREMDKWMQFAIRKHVEILQLDFGYPASSMWFKAQCGLSRSFTCLKSLSLSGLKVNTGLIEFILATCPLEHLSLVIPGCSFLDLEVSVGASHPLKRLEIVNSPNPVKKLCAPNLTHFKYCGCRLNPQTVNVPMLADLLLVVASLTGLPLVNVLKPFWSNLPQLESLKLGILDMYNLKSAGSIPKLTKLKRLTVAMYFNQDKQCNDFIRLMKACPSLQAFAIELIPRLAGIRSRSVFDDAEQLKDPPAHEGINASGAFACLKVLELRGAEGDPLDLQLTKHVIKNSPYLEKLLIDTRPVNKPYPPTSNPSEILQRVEQKARKLGRKFPNITYISVT